LLTRIVYEFEPDLKKCGGCFAKTICDKRIDKFQAHIDELLGEVK